jgi:hypothetical protein
VVFRNQKKPPSPFDVGLRHRIGIGGMEGGFSASRHPEAAGASEHFVPKVPGSNPATD